MFSPAHRSTLRASAAAALATVAAAACASPASASDRFALNVSAPSTPVVGKPMLLRAHGTIPLRDLPYTYWFSLDAIPAAVTSTCPADRWESVQLASGTGGATIVLAQRVNPDGTGRFTIPVGIKPTAPGKVLLCGYVDDGETHTLARGQLMLKIRSRQRSRRAIARAKARCRRLHRRSRRSACLRAIRRANGRTR